jgi:hypothetical protein
MIERSALPGQRKRLPQAAPTAANFRLHGLRGRVQFSFRGGQSQEAGSSSAAAASQRRHWPSGLGRRQSDVQTAPGACSHAFRRQRAGTRSALH